MPITDLPPIDDTLWVIDAKFDAHMTYSGMTFKVIEHKRTNVIIEAQGTPVPGARPMRVRVNPHQLTRATADARTVAAATPTFLPPLPLGAVFTLDAGTLRGVNADDLLVVIGHNGIAHKVARLGGNEDRYWPRVARAGMHPIEIGNLLDSLKALLAG